MAITLQTQFSKKCGLPNYSSISASASVEIEVHDLESIPSEIKQLYHVLQASVDSQLAEHVGFIPDDSYGITDAQMPSGNPGPNGSGSHNPNGNHPSPAIWNCSDKQRQLIADLVVELGLTDDEVDARSARLFDKPAHRLDKLGASGLISSLLAEAGTRRQRNGRSNGSNGNGSRRGNPVSTNGNGGSGR